MLAQAIDRRNASITSHAETTDELCHEAITACNETTAKVEALVKNIGAQVNTKAIVDGIKTQLDKGIRDEIIQPFINHSQELGQRVLPLLEQIREASGEARTLWRGRIWKTAWASTSLVALTFVILIAAGMYDFFRNYAERKSAEKIANVERLMNHNQEAFRQLAIAQVPVHVVRTESYGVMNPRGFALVVEDADSAEMRRVEGRHNGFVFFTSNLSEKQIQEIQRQIEKLSGASKERGK